MKTLRNLTWSDSPYFIESDEAVVEGDIPDSVRIEGNGNLKVRGSIGEAVVRMAGNITVDRGASGPGYIEAGGDIKMRFAENSTLVSGRDIAVSSASMHSNLSAGRSITVSGEQGVLVGGTAQAYGRISAVRIGSRLKTKTKLQVGIVPLFRSEYQRLTSLLSSVSHQLGMLRKNIDHLDRLSPGEITPRMARHRALLPLMRFRERHLLDRLEICERRISMVKVQLEKETSAFVDVFGELFPEVTIILGWEATKVKEHLKEVTFFVRDGKIVSEPLPIGTFRR